MPNADPGPGSWARGLGPGVWGAWARGPGPGAWGPGPGGCADSGSVLSRATAGRRSSASDRRGAGSVRQSWARAPGPKPRDPYPSIGPRLRAACPEPGPWCPALALGPKPRAPGPGPEPRAPGPGPGLGGACGAAARGSFCGGPLGSSGPPPLCVRFFVYGELCTTGRPAGRRPAPGMGRGPVGRGRWGGEGGQAAGREPTGGRYGCTIPLESPMILRRCPESRAACRETWWPIAYHRRSPSFLS